GVNQSIRNLSVTEITTSSISLNWTEPLGNSSFYRVQWKNGSSTLNTSVFEKTTTISNLTAGVRYGINVTAVRRLVHRQVEFNKRNLLQ
uniref:Fibronectin type-III domain-containing protein n=1 Tax=Oryzias latipes TaxID=8090 RepID=A0A3B3HYG5_ORYLA